MKGVFIQGVFYSNTSVHLKILTWRMTILNPFNAVHDMSQLHTLASMLWIYVVCEKLVTETRPTIYQKFKLTTCDFL
jgi:hypothetical protein